jgi:hypothetical protein
LAVNVFKDLGSLHSVMNHALNPEECDLEVFINKTRATLQQLDEILSESQGTMSTQQFAAVALVKFLEKSEEMENYVSNILRTKPISTTFEDLIQPTLTEETEVLVFLIFYPKFSISLNVTLLTLTASLM